MTIAMPDRASNLQTPNYWVSLIASWSETEDLKPACSNTAIAVPPIARIFHNMRPWNSFARGYSCNRSRSRSLSFSLILLLVALVCSSVWVTPAACAAPAPARGQEDPELRAVVQRAIQQAQCFSDQYDSAVWYALMEPRLRRYVKDSDERLEILRTVYCETHREDVTLLPPGLVMAVLDVESGFDPWAVSSAGAVGLMQVMPFWPRELGVQNQLVRVAPNIRMGCEILRYYLRAENRDWSRALARYNGSVGRNTYPALVMQRWQRAWRF